MTYKHLDTTFSTIQRTKGKNNLRLLFATLVLLVVLGGSSCTASAIVAEETDIDGGRGQIESTLGYERVQSDTDEEDHGDAYDSTQPLFDIEGIRRLRGSYNADDPTDLSATKNFIKHQMKGLQSLTKLYHDNDKKGLARAYRSMIDSSQELSSAVEHDEEIKTVVNSLDLPQMEKIDSHSVSSVSDSDVVEYFEQNGVKQFDFVTNHLQDVLNQLERIETDNRRLSKRDDLFSHDNSFEELYTDPAFGFTPHGKTSQFRPHNNFGFDKEMKRMLKQTRTNARSHISRITKRANNGGSDHRRLNVDARRERRLQSLPTDQCRPKCEVDNVKCNCERLYSCVQQLSSLDVAVMMTKGYIERDAGSEDYGNYTTDVDKINVFDAGYGGIWDKYQRIQQKLGDPSNENECREVLEEAHSTCSPSDSCTGQNTDSIQLSVDEVCESVDTDIKLLFESIQDEFDLVFTWKVRVGIVLDVNSCVPYEVFEIGMERSQTVYTGCGYTYILEEDRNKQCGVGDTSKIIFDYYDDGKQIIDDSCGLRRGQALYPGCGYMYVTLEAREEQCDKNLPTDKDSLSYLVFDNYVNFEANNDGAYCGSLSYSSCSNFIQAFDSFYQTRDESMYPSGNPMQKYDSIPLDVRSNAIYDRVSFPIDYDFDQSSHGVNNPNSLRFVNANLRNFPGEYLSGNLALGKKATQSSDNGDYLAELAVDGDINTFSHSQGPTNEWWQVDLGEPVSVQRVTIVNRQDCCYNRLRNFHIKLINDQGATVADMVVPSLGKDPETFVFASVTANIVRIENGENPDGYVHLAEVEVYGDTIKMGGNIALNKPTKVSSTYSNNFVASYGVDGDVDTTFISMNNGEYFQVDLGANYQVDRITLVNRKGCCQDRLRNFYIKLLDDKEKTLSEKYITHTVGERETFTFAGGLARYVKIEMPARSDGIAYIQLAEVEVYGELTGKCLKSQVTYHHAQKGMRTCDDSMELLLGNLMSVGTLQAITKDIEENGVERIPGFCCLDMATTSQYLGENFDPAEGMTCQNYGYWHLGLSSLACSNAKGKWFRSACLTLKECTDNRPVNGTDGYSNSFEDFAQGILIDDPYDEEQCRATRSGLGFAEDHPFDTEVCETFYEYMCDENFDEIDSMADGLDEPPVWNDITYEEITYEPDAELPFTPLPEAPTLVDISLTTTEQNENFGSLKQAMLNLEVTKVTTANTYKLFKDSSSCDLIPDDIGVGFGIMIPNPFNIACVIARIIGVNILLMASFALEIAFITTKHALMMKVIGAGKVYDDYYYSKALYENSVETDKWAYKSFNILNQNVHEQHKSMRDQLQERHEQMVNDINQITVDTANELGCQIIIAMDGECQPSRRRLLEGEKPKVEIEVTWPENVNGTGPFGGITNIKAGVKKVIGTINNINANVDDMMNDEVERKHTMDENLDNMMSSMRAILMKLEMDTSVLDGLNKSKSRKSKKAKQVKEDDLFERNLLDAEEVAKDELKSQVQSIEVQVKEVKSKVELIEGKVISMEGKVESMEGKVDKMEKTMEEMKDMLHQMMTRGVADA